MNELDFIQEVVANKQRRVVHFPDKQEAESFINGLFHFLFVNTSAEVNTDRSFKVSSSGSPGPAPTKITFPLLIIFIDSFILFKTNFLLINIFRLYRN